MAESRETLFEAVKSVKSDLDLVGFLSGVSDSFGFIGFLVIDLPSQNDEILAPCVTLSSMPESFIEGYDALGLLKNSPIFSRLRRSTVPLSWSIDTLEAMWPPEFSGKAVKLFKDYNVTMGVAFPVHAADGSRGVVIFDGNREPLGSQDLSELGMLVIHAYEVHMSLRGTAPEIGILTTRELEVLHWAANGKTSTEIAAILSLSDHTVNTYMNAAMRKLDCVNRTQLVAKALRLHLIS